MVILITGKAQAGKTTYARRLAAELAEEGGRVSIIDGDDWRRRNENLDFSDEGRLRNLLSAAEEAARLEAQGNVVLVSFVSPKREWRQMMRALWQQSLLVYVPGGKLWEGTVYERPDYDELLGR